MSSGIGGNHVQPSSNSTHQLSPDYDPVGARGGSTGTSPVTWTLGGLGDGKKEDVERRSSSLLDTTSVSLEPGVFAWLVGLM